MKKSNQLAALFSLLAFMALPSTAAAADECTWTNFDRPDALEGSGKFCSESGALCRNSSECPAGEACQDRPVGRSYCNDADDEFVIEVKKRFKILDKHWDGRWDDSDQSNDSPLCLLIEGLSVLERASHFAHADRWLLSDAYEFSANSIHKLKPKCSYDDTTRIAFENPACDSGWIGFSSYEDYRETCFVPRDYPLARSGVSGEIEVQLGAVLPFSHAISNATKVHQEMLEKGAANRASLILHEAAHRGGRTHNLTQGGREKDQRYQSAYTNGTPSVWSQQVDWLMDYIWLDEKSEAIRMSPRPVISQAARAEAAAYANEILRDFFLDEPGFRVSVIDVDELYRASAAGTSLVVQAEVFKGSDYQNAGTKTTYTPAFAGDACGLVKVAGDLEHRDHSIWISEEDYPLTPYGTTIKVQALVVDNDTSPNPDKTIGHAQCFPGKRLVPIGDDGNLTVTLKLNGSDDKEQVLLADDDRHVCFLMGIKGITEGTHERARAVRIEGEWVAQLRANNNSSKESLEAKFGCIEANRVDTVSISTDGIQESIDFVEIEPTFVPYSDRECKNSEGTTVPCSPLDETFAYPFSCVLSEVHGRFRNTNDLEVFVPIAVPHLQLPSGSSFTLQTVQDKGISDRRIGGTMTCFDYSPVAP